MSCLACCAKKREVSSSFDSRNQSLARHSRQVKSLVGQRIDILEQDNRVIEEANPAKTLEDYKESLMTLAQSSIGESLICQVCANLIVNPVECKNCGYISAKNVQ